MTFMKRLSNCRLVYQPGNAVELIRLAIDGAERVIEKLFRQTARPVFSSTSGMFSEPLGPMNQHIPINVPAERAMISRQIMRHLAGSLLHSVDPGADQAFFSNKRPLFSFAATGLLRTAWRYAKFSKCSSFRKLGDVPGDESRKTSSSAISNLLASKPPNTKAPGWPILAFVPVDLLVLVTDVSPAGTFGLGRRSGDIGPFCRQTVRGLALAAITQYIPSNSYPFQSDFQKYVLRQDLIGSAQAGAGNTSSPVTQIASPSRRGAEQNK